MQCISNWLHNALNNIYRISMTILVNSEIINILLNKISVSDEYFQSNLSAIFQFQKAFSVINLISVINKNERNNQ